jgi:hypothetical protein
LDKRTKIIIGSTIGVIALVGIIYFIRKRVKKNEQEKIISTGDWKNPSGIDTNTKGFKILMREIKGTEEVLDGYEKDGLILKNTATGGKSSENGAKATYYMRTKNFPTLKSGIEKDNELNEKQRKLLLEIYQNYFDLYLPSYFDKDAYNPNAKWYTDMGGKVYDKYKL